jgi:hypothetical protein
VPPLCSLCLRGESYSATVHHRGTEIAEDAQRTLVCEFPRCVVSESYIIT